MAIEYRFFNRSDEELIKTSELPREGGIAVAVRSTGYDIARDEVVELSIVDFAGNELFSQVVKPQNLEEWGDEAASGGIKPADVADAPELYQFEDEICELFENATVVVGQHIGFIGEVIESSWVSLPPYEPFDLVEQFRLSHCAADYPTEPAAAVTLEGIAGYYALDFDESTTTGVARAVAAAYLKLVEEHASEREAKGPAHWEAYERRLADERRDEERRQAAERAQQVKTSQINAILWMGAMIIFGNVAVQLHIRGFDPALVVMAVVATAFFAAKWASCLYSIYKLKKLG